MHEKPSSAGSPSGGVVLVTGGCGYLAGWLICGLLRDGYTARTTLRNLSAADAVSAAVAGQVDVNGRLSFHAADLLRDDGWAAAVRGCDFVLHVASPMGQGAPRGVDLVGPAREGTLRVLKAAAQAGVRHVVSTSSTAAAMPARGSTAPSDESVWSDLKARGVMEYTRSKTLAEQAAWAFMRSSGAAMTLSTVLPGLVLGPVMTKSATGSVELVQRMLTGRMPAMPRIGFSIVDVRDVVELHLLALRAPAAHGQRSSRPAIFCGCPTSPSCCARNWVPARQRCRAACCPTCCCGWRPWSRTTHAALRH